LEILFFKAGFTTTGVVNVLSLIDCVESARARYIQSYTPFMKEVVKNEAAIHEILDYCMSKIDDDTN